MANRITLFHGGSSIVRIPDLSMSREDIDFGRGFYLAEDFNRSAKWACRKVTSIVNEYELCLDGLKVHRFSADIEWLDFVLANRREEKLEGRFAEYAACDVLIGPIADDKLFSLLELYEDGLIAASLATEVMNCMNYGKQYVLKTEKAVRGLLHRGHVQLIGKEREEYKRSFNIEAQEAGRKTRELLKAKNKER